MRQYLALSQWPTLTFEVKRKVQVVLRQCMQSGVKSLMRCEQELKLGKAIMCAG